MTIHVTPVYDPPQPLPNVAIGINVDDPTQINVADYVSNPDGATMHFRHLSTVTSTGSVGIAIGDVPVAPGGITAANPSVQIFIRAGGDLRQFTLTAAVPGGLYRHLHGVRRDQRVDGHPDCECQRGCRRHVARRST